jgi:transposase
MGVTPVHAASIEVSSRDTVKTDKRDSLKIAQQLSAGRLRGVRVLTEGEEPEECHKSVD